MTETNEETMGWTDIFPHDVGETDIQRYVAAWGREQPGSWSRVGAPAWLEALRPVTANTSCASDPLGYSFRPDILGESNGVHHVLELKCARKYEPLALAEVLHHAHLLSQGLAQPPQQMAAPFIPVLVTQYSAWLRSALAFLRLNGLRANSIKYVEFTSLRIDGETILWFDEPFSPWTPCSPPQLPDGLSTGPKHWYRVSGANTWIALDDPLDQRPALWTVPYLMLTTDHPNSRVLTWHGGPTDPGRYALWRAGRSAQPVTL